MSDANRILTLTDKISNEYIQTQNQNFMVQGALKSL